LLVAACGGQTPEPVAEPGPPPPPAPVLVETAPAPSASAPAATTPALSDVTKPPSGPAPVLVYRGVFATPESVLYDAAADRYLVSNINGKPVDVDDNGYISELTPDGSVKNAKFIAGGVNKVKLDAPKGLALVGNELWVTDLTRVRKFDAKTGAPRGEIALPEATFANDIVAAPDGRVFVADSGIKLGANGFEPTGSAQVIVISKGGKAKTLAKSKELGGPNGLVWGPKGLLVNTFLAAEVYRLNDAGAREDVLTVPKGGLDGMQLLGDALWVSSWEAQTVYRGTLSGNFEPVITNVKGPADFGYDSKRNRLLLPRFMEDLVEVYDIK
jgi:sugar lactone lactonase YvrE